MESHAAERDKFASELVVQVADPLKQAATQYEEIRKCHVEYHGKLEKEREAAYGDLKKAKGKYDGACQEVEARRKKMESAFDHGKAKAQSAYQQQILEMNNYKAWPLQMKPPCSGANLRVEPLSHQHQCDK